MSKLASSVSTLTLARAVLRWNVLNTFEGESVKPLRLVYEDLKGAAPEVRAELLGLEPVRSLYRFMREREEWRVDPDSIGAAMI